MRVVATAGHVDHGKSTLIWALTGTDPDRWAEEKARGMTIDLGFASTTLPSGHEVGFVDVPGHGRFVKNMLAGVSAVDACLFVVDATEGWKAQSEEHLRILDLLGITRGLVALTKVGLADEDDRELAVLDVTEHVEDTFLAGAEMVGVDVPAGIGLDELRAALDRLVAATPAATDRGRPRLWIDRAFAMRGAGTVVTGTLTGGTIAIDDELVVEPGGRRVRVRGLQSHYRTLTRAEPGRRLAVNVTGADPHLHHHLERGMALVKPGQWHVTSTLDASLRVLESVEEPLGNRGAFAAYIGSGDFPVRLRTLGRDSAIDPGEEGLVRLWLDVGRRIPVMPGDRYVLRELGRGETIGGGQILDVEPVLPRARAAPSLSVDRVIEERGWVDAAQLERLTGDRRTPTAGPWVLAPSVLASTEARVAGAAAQAGAAGLDPAGLSPIERAVLGRGVTGVSVVDGRVFDESSVPTSMSDAAARVLAALEKTPWTPPDLPLSDRAALRELERRQLAYQTGELWFAASAVDSAVKVLRDLLDEAPQGFTVSDARQALGCSRKYVLPLLAHLDSRGITRRQGDYRVAGPRMGVSR